MDLTTNLNLLAIFAIIGGVGFLFLILSLVVGDVFEAVGFDLDGPDTGSDFGLLDSRVIAVFVTAFGGFGVIGAQLGYGPVASSAFGLLGGLIFAAVVSIFGRFLVSQQASSSVVDDQLVGRNAQVTVDIRSGQLGQITARVGEERVEKLARTKDGVELKAGSIVKITAIAGDSVIVETE